MTVCIAALFNWNYGTAEGQFDWGKAAIVASDRMLTSGDIQYEPQQQKLAMAGTRTVVLVAGDISTHSEAIQRMHDKVPAGIAARPEDVALIYGREIQAIRRRISEDIFLSPFGLNTDSFIAQQKDMSEGFVSRIATQLQDFQGDDVEAIVVGMENDAVRLYCVNKFGVVNNCEDIGFAAIGIGAWHARSQFMQARFVNNWGAAQAFATVIAAKKAADIAPGVGKVTDFNLIFRHEVRRIWPNMGQKLEMLYAEFEDGRNVLVNKGIEQLQEFLDAPVEKTAKTEAENGTTPDSGNQGPSPSSGPKIPATGVE
jgi:hypothetical protein